MNNTIKIVLVILSHLLLFLKNGIICAQSAPVNVIYETDMCLDVDDVGALAVLHGLQNEEKVNLLGVCYNEVHPLGASVIDAINTYSLHEEITNGYEISLGKVNQ